MGRATVTGFLFVISLENGLLLLQQVVLLKDSLVFQAE